MAYINDTAYDQALQWINDGDRVDICDTEPTNVTQARTTYSLGNASVTVGAPTDGDTSGRKVVVPAISAGSVTSTGNAQFWALSNSTVLQATGSLASAQQVTSGNDFTLPAFDITFPDAT